MKNHIAPVYLILGPMAVSSLAIGASETAPAPSTHVVHAQALLPSPSSFLFEVTRDGRTVPARLVVVGSLAASRGRKAG